MMLSEMDLSALALKLRHDPCRLHAREVQAVNRHLFLPDDPLTEPIDFCLVLGSRRCEYRVKAALEASGRGPHRFIMSGGGLDRAGQTEAHRMGRYLLQQGVAADRILYESRSLYTKENLANVKALLTGLGLEDQALSIAVVTGGFHMRRTMLLLREEWKDRPRWQALSCSAYGPHTHPDAWHQSQAGRKVIGDELGKLLRMETGAAS